MATASRKLSDRAVSNDSFDRLLWAQEETEDQRLLEKSRCVRQGKEQYSCKEDNETTPWLKHTCWPVLQKNRPLDILTASTLPPSKRPIENYYLGRWSNRSVESPRVNEAKLQILMRAVDQMFDRAHETLEHTHYRLRCWLQTYHQRHFRPVAFKQLGTEASRAGYISIWKQLMCYVFRSWATPKRLRDEIYGVTFQPSESRQMEYIWSTLLEELLRTQSDIEQSEDEDVKYDIDSGTECNSGADSDCETDSNFGDDESVNDNLEDYDGGRGDEESAERLDRNLHSAPPEENCDDLRLPEALFQLTMAFWTFLDHTGDMTASVLVHFTAIRGIHRQSLAYKSAYNYTPDLSKLIWVGRLLFLEYALPLRAYGTLAYPWPSRDSYPDQARRLEEIRTKYLLRGAFSPMSEILELRAFGRSIVKKEGGRTNLTWAADGQSFTIGGSNRVTLQNFTYMHCLAVVKVEERIGQLMLGWEPFIDLGSICDDFNCIIPGWSFLEEEHNDLRFAYKALSRRAWSSCYLRKPFAKHGHWLPETCNAYIQSETELKNEIFAAIHLTAGLPGRGTEITSIRIHNTAEVMRNLKFRDGRLLLVIGYNKARASNHHAFYIVRYLPRRLARLVFLYLVYVRPFIDFLATQLQFPHLRATEYLFPDPRNKQKHLSTSQATDVLKRLTQRFPTPMTLSLYRQSALAIAKRYIKELIEKTDFYNPKASNDPLRIISAGVGHHPRMLLTEYATDNALPARLQPELLDMYLRLSTLWQNWNVTCYTDHQKTLQNSSAPSTFAICEKHSQKRRSPPDMLPSERPNKRQLIQMPDIAHPTDGSGFRYNELYKILICVSCESTLQPSIKSWYRHLNSMHRILGSECKALIHRFQAYDITPQSKLVVPKQRITAIEGLRVSHGFRCRICPSSNSMFTIHERKMKDHISSMHRLKPLQAKRAGQYKSCFLQTFSLAPCMIRYFEVTRP